MAGADLLLSKSILRIRLGAEQWEDVPIDAEMIQRRLNTFLRQVPSSSQTPQQAVLAAVAREAESSIIRQSCIREEDESWRLYPELPITTVTRPGSLAASVKYDMRECKVFANFPGPFVWDEFDKHQVQEYEQAYAFHLQEHGYAPSNTADSVHVETTSEISDNDSEPPDLISSDEEEEELYSPEAEQSDAAYSPDTYTLSATHHNWRPMPFGLPPTSVVYPEAHAPLEQNSSVAATGVITLVNAEAEVASCETPPQPVETMQDRTNTMPGPRYNTSVSPLPQIMAELQAMEQSFSDSEVSDPSSAYLSNIDEEFSPLSVTEVLEPVEPDEPPTLLQVQNARDTSGWQFPPALYRSYDLRYGPFILDACSDKDGKNSLCPTWWSPSDSYSKHLWGGCKIWCNPPYAEVEQVLNKAIAGYKVDPENTCILMVLPDWPASQWWDKLTKTGWFSCVGYYPSGTDLFTASPRNQGERRDLGPTRWGVVMAIIGKSWGTGVCLPWTPWPPTQPPTVAWVRPPTSYPAVGDMPTMGADLDDNQRHDIERFVHDFADVWAYGNSTGRTNVVTHRIDTGSAAPINQRPHRQSAKEAQILREEIQTMKAAGIIVESRSSWASPPVMVPKKDGSVRVCIDYRALNNVSVRDMFPLPRMEDILHSLGTAQFFTKIDLKAGYWQIALDPADRHKPAFRTQDGLFEFIMMPFGLQSAPATFQRLMNTIFDDMLWHNVSVYLDDIVVYTRTWQEHLATLDEVFLRLRAAGLKASPGKCDIAQDRLLYLGHVITREGVLPDPANVEAIQQAERPRTVTAVKSFIGMTTYYSDYVQGHATQAKPLYDLFKKNVGFTWTQECETAFQGLKQSLISPPVLRRPDTSLPYLLHTDWSLLAIGAVLSQVDLNGEEHPIAFGSRILHGAERNYSATEGECLAVVHFIEHWTAWSSVRSRHRPCGVEMANDYGTCRPSGQMGTEASMPQLQYRAQIGLQACHC